MAGILTFLLVFAAILAGWYLFEWLWDRRLFTHGRPDPENFARNLRARQIRDLIEATPAPKILDVRPAAHYAGGAIPGAVSVPFTGPEFEARVKAEFSPHEPLMLYCSGGFRSRHATRELRRLGYHKLYHLHRGIGSWRLAGFPVEMPS